MKQLIIARKDLQMSPGKLAAQVSHASMAFLTTTLREHYERKPNCFLGNAWKYDYFTRQETFYPQLYMREELNQWAKEAREQGKKYFYYRPVNPDEPNGKLELCDLTYHIDATISFDMDTWNDWICGSFTKIICEAKNKYQLEKAIDMAADLNLVEHKDYFLIKDNCLTELTPEEVDENGIGRTLTCIGFRPLPNEIIDKISHKYELYK